MLGDFLGTKRRASSGTGSHLHSKRCPEVHGSQEDGWEKITLENSAFTSFSDCKDPLLHLSTTLSSRNWSAMAMLYWRLGEKHLVSILSYWHASVSPIGYSSPPVRVRVWNPGGWAGNMDIGCLTKRHVLYGGINQLTNNINIQGNRKVLLLFFTKIGVILVHLYAFWYIHKWHGYSFKIWHHCTKMMLFTNSFKLQHQFMTSLSREV